MSLSLSFILATVRLTRHCHHQDKFLTANSLQDSYLIQSTWLCSDFKLCVSNYSSNYDLALKTQGDSIPYAILQPHTTHTHTHTPLRQQLLWLRFANQCPFVCSLAQLDVNMPTVECAVAFSTSLQHPKMPGFLNVQNERGGKTHCMSHVMWLAVLLTVLSCTLTHRINTLKERTGKTQ